MAGRALVVALVTAMSASPSGCARGLAEGGVIAPEAGPGVASARTHREVSADRASMAASTRAPILAATSAPSIDAGTPPAWLPDLGAVAPSDSLRARFAAPAGFARVSLPVGSFGAFLRELPLAPPSTAVSAFDGRTILPAGHPSLAAVVALDVGKADLQQCADSIVRLHAEWMWSTDRAEHIHYDWSAGSLSFANYVRGERHYWSKGQFLAKTVASRPKSHELLRSYLDEVFGVANTASLRRQGAPVRLEDLTPGDFFVVSGTPFGHAVLILDMARAEDGRRVLLVGQGYMPAQNFHVLRHAGGPWFAVDPGASGLATPFWEPFPWSALRRLPAGT